MSDRVDRVGQQVGNYRLERLLGSGGFADVYLGKHVFLDSFAAIKLLHTNLAQGDIEGFQSEGRTLVHLIHPHIVRILDFGLEGNTPFLVMDYAPNGTLRQRYKRGERLPLATIVEYVNQVASALQHAHDEKIIHRDIKPENMLLGRREEILLSDFGIAVIAQSTHADLAGDTTGTIVYMAPEQIQAHPRPASDQYSLGIVVYEWLTGYPPFTGSFTEIAAKHMMVPPTALREKVPGITPEVEQVVLTALAKDPKQRFGSVRAFANALEQASKGARVEMPASSSEGASPQRPIVLASPQTPIPPPVEAHQPVQTPAALQAAQPTLGDATVMNTPNVPVPIALPPDVRAAYEPTIITAPEQPHAPTVVAPPGRPGHAGTLPSAPKEPERRGMSRRAALIAGLSAVGVVAVGGATWAVISHNAAGQTTGGAQTTPSPTTHSPTPTTTTQVNQTVLAQDNFNRQNQSGWGTASDGQMWGGDANTSPDFSIANGMGQIQRQANTGNLYTAVLGSAHQDTEVIATAMLDTFNNSHIGVALRYSDNNHYYKVLLDGGHLSIFIRNNNVGKALQTVPFSPQPNTPYTIRFRAVGTTLLTKAWQANAAEPTDWMVAITDNTFPSGKGGFRPQLDHGVTLRVTRFQEIVAVGQ